MLACPVPCDDISELMSLELDANDMVSSYSLRKRTCGAEIGNASLLADLVVNRSIDGVLALTGDDIVEHYGPLGEAEFLYFKHLVALQQTAKVYAGDASGGAQSSCAIDEICHSHKDTLIIAVIRIDLMTEQIRACGNCGSCGRTTKRRNTA